MGFIDNMKNVIDTITGNIQYLGYGLAALALGWLAIRFYFGGKRQLADNIGQLVMIFSGIVIATVAPQFTDWVQSLV